MSMFYNRIFFECMFIWIKKKENTQSLKIKNTKYTKSIFTRKKTVENSKIMRNLRIKK